MSANEANAAQNRAKKEIDLLEEPIRGFKEKVLLYWYQARGDPKSKAGDRAIIESIQKAPVRVIFDNDELKAKMILDVENPFTSAYVVDVVIETINDRPALYKIARLHEKHDKPSDYDQKK